MRLSLCFLLLILAVSCYKANAGKVCKAIVRESFIFILFNEAALRVELEKYDAPEEAVEAKMKVKECINDIKFMHKAKVGLVLGLILEECGLDPWLRKHLLLIVSLMPKLLGSEN
ncbi:secretoglobin family 1D member 1-like [Psammomys obesus]|uniref:secretoglobin family 1D member 1-like n=1 Tax=Psammomys obesus TaxID=48139 RepID=UPI0024535006|nr:secretoglobin family 1D member 1-like [Psammomys obesus]